MNGSASLPASAHARPRVRAHARARVAAALLSAGLAGCILNSSLPLPEGGTPPSHRAVLVYGVKAEARWDTPRIGVQLTEYDLKRQAITGNCFLFNRTETSAPAVPGKINWFAFDVPPGYYVYSPFNGAGLEGPSVAFEAPAGRATYIGDFVLVDRHTMQLRRPPEGERSALYAALPQLPRALDAAQTVPVAPPHPFLCTP
ncbi:MAG TPA: hypothetical protein VF793_19165 [Telluria sp.]